MIVDWIIIEKGRVRKNVGLSVYVFQSLSRKYVTYIWNGSVCVVSRVCGR